MLFKRSEKHLLLGQLGEKLAQRYLKEKGYAILETNFSNYKGKKIGEIDIIAKKDNYVIFVEVKTRKSTSFKYSYLPEQNITLKKIHNLTKIAEIYMRSKTLKNPYRFDAISIIYDGTTKKAQVRHLEHIFL